MTLSLCRHYKSCGKSGGNECLKRKALRRLRKTDIEGADMTRWVDCQSCKRFKSDTIFKHFLSH